MMAALSANHPPCAFRRALLGLCAILVVAGLAGGCGKKGPPKLPDIAAPEGVTNLAAVQQGEEIVLTWTSTAVAGYQVYRSAESVADGDCAGCPILFKRMAKLPSTGDGETPATMVYREPSMAATRYHFKVVPYDEQGQLGPDSNIATIVTE
jgi:predicted small lipoprotein YifL